MIEAVAIEEILNAPEFPALVEEYARESSIAGLPHPRVKLESYVALEQTGQLRSFRAIKDGALIGFITVLAPILPHFDAPVAVAESFFVAAAHRAGGPGLRLLAIAEAEALDAGSPGLIVCAPFGGRLFEILPRLGYVESNRVFFKRLARAIPSMDEKAMDRVRELEQHILSTDVQMALEYQHELHAGIYDRTVYLPAGRRITGVPVKIDTLLTIVGDVIIGLDDNEQRVTGFTKIRAAAHRMGAFTAITDAVISMAFGTTATTVEEAEREFTDEASRLASRRSHNEVASCPV